MKKQDWKGAIFTLNHERILELDAKQVGLSLYLPDVENYNHDQNTSRSLVYLHGACHLFIAGAQGTLEETPEHYPSWCVRHILDGDDLQAEYNRHSPVAIRYFTRAKRPKKCGFFGKLERYWWECAKARQESGCPIVIVGVSPPPKHGGRDDHIWGPLAETEAPLVYCEGRRGAQGFLCWAGQIILIISALSSVTRMKTI